MDTPTPTMATHTPGHPHPAISTGAHVDGRETPIPGMFKLHPGDHLTLACTHTLNRTLLPFINPSPALTRPLLPLFSLSRPYQTTPSLPTLSCTVYGRH
ncbi:hypothetical protein Pcinc_038196 [Petrolisthes cinctipes]|uniref:Uncharacterized protein n=1 Tax=Petrolisthes cinctipes TaxID=88211 RepID=A0AAE1BUG9_PETCI|nr:hypothetical protein Pcinc_038196 [Petrolisthes cinctipes]